MLKLQARNVVARDASYSELSAYLKRVGVVYVRALRRHQVCLQAQTGWKSFRFYMAAGPLKTG